MRLVRNLLFVLGIMLRVNGIISQNDTIRIECAAHADIYIVLTGSDSIIEIPRLMIGARNGLAEWFSRTRLNAENGPQVSVCVYGTVAVEVIKPGNALLPGKIKSLGGFSHLDRGIECARNSSQANHRADVPQYMVLLVGEDPLGPQDLTVDASEQIRRAREQDGFARITLTTVSGDVFQDAIQDFGDPGFRLHIESDFSEFKKLIKPGVGRQMNMSLWRQYCPESAGWSSWGEWGGCSTTCEWGSRERIRNCTRPPPGNGTAPCHGSPRDVDNCKNCSEPDIPCRSYADIYIVLTASDNMVELRQLMIGLRNGLVGWFARTGNDTQVSVCAYGTSAEEQIRPEDPLNADRIKFVGGFSHLDLGIECARNSSQANRRVESPQYMVLIVAEDPIGFSGVDYTDAAREQIRLARAEGFVRITLTTVTDNAYGDLLQDFADPGYWLNLESNDFSHFQSRANPASGERFDVQLWRQYCPRSAGWSYWSHWSECSVSCGVGARERNRTCSDPPSGNGTAPCRGTPGEDESCNNRPCPLDGAWTLWAIWSDCSVTCGVGSMERLRSCANPAPQFGGADCPSQANEQGSCIEGLCPVDGAWTLWAIWSDCSMTCGAGSKVRFRSCTNPAPQFGGAACPSQANEQENCTEGACPAGCVVSTWSRWVPMFCPVLEGLAPRRYQFGRLLGSSDWCALTRSRHVIQQPTTPGTCPSLFEDYAPETPCEQSNQAGCFSLMLGFEQVVPCSSQLSITRLMFNCIRMSINPLCWDTVCQLEMSILSCMRRYSDCSEREAMSFLPPEYQCLFRSKCQNGTLSPSPCKSLTDESYNFGAILGVDLEDCWRLLMIGRSETEKKRFVPTVYSCIRHKFLEAGLSRSNMRLAMDRVQMELGCRQNLTDLDTLQQLETRAITFMDFRTNRTTVGVYGDPHLRTYQRPQLTTCASEGAQVYLKSRILDISGVNSKLCPESRATFLSQVRFEFKSLLNPDVVTARYDARNGQHPVQIEQILADVTPVDAVRLEYVNWRRIKMIWNHTGVFIDFSRWGSSYFFTLRVTESLLQSGEGLLVEGCPEDQIIDRNPVLTNLAETCDDVSVIDPLEELTTFGTRQTSSGTIGTRATATPPSLPENNRTIHTTTSLPSQVATEPQATTGKPSVSMQPNLVTAQEARSACENGSSGMPNDVMLLRGDNLEMCMFDVLVTGNIAYVVMAEEAVNSQVEATEQDPVITDEAYIWTFIEEELLTPSTVPATTTTPVPASPPDGCTIDDAKLAGLLALAILLLIILIILIIVIIILWRRNRSREHKLKIDGLSKTDDYERRHKSDKVGEGRYSTLIDEKPDKQNMNLAAAPAKHHVGTSLEMSSYGPAEKSGKADKIVVDKATYLTVKSNDAKDEDGSSNRGSYIHPTDDYDFPLPPPPNDDERLDYLTPSHDADDNHITLASADGGTEDNARGVMSVDYMTSDNDQARDLDDIRESYITPVRPSNLSVGLVDDNPADIDPGRAGTGNIEREDYETPVHSADPDVAWNVGDGEYMAPENDGTVSVDGHVETADYLQPATDENPYANM